MPMSNKSNKILKKVLIVGLSLLFILGGIVAYTIYYRVFAPNTVAVGEKGTYVFIPTGASFTAVKMAVNLVLFDDETFEWTARQMKYDTKIKPGRYYIQNGMNNREIVSLLRSGKQMPLKVTFNNIRTVEQLAGKISHILEADSNSIVMIFRDEKLQAENGFTKENCISMIIPNTYEFYWNTSAAGFYKRMLKEYNIFWNTAREDKRKALGLNREQVSVIASIVEQETQKDQEKNMIAGVYLNRYRKNWKLEADPTLVFALGDFSIRRVLNEYKLIKSPYNTYLNTGLPPGPICIPGIASIEAVLNPANHQYMYFCAKDDFSGFHAFARSYDEHLVNARKFQKALTNRGILG